MVHIPVLKLAVAKFLVCLALTGATHAIAVPESNAENAAHSNQLTTVAVNGIMTSFPSDANASFGAGEDAVCVGFLQASTGQCWGYCHACFADPSGSVSNGTTIALNADNTVKHVTVSDVEFNSQVSQLHEYTYAPDGYVIAGGSSGPVEDGTCYGYYHISSSSCIGVCVQC